MTERPSRFLQAFDLVPHHPDWSNPKIKEIILEFTDQYDETYFIARIQKRRNRRSGLVLTRFTDVDTHEFKQTHEQRVREISKPR